MTRRLSMTTRRELTEAVGERYRRSDRTEKRQILDEFIELTGYHRKHAIRVLCRVPQPQRAKPGPQRRYDDEVRAALITLWEAADRICGKRLKALIPTLIDSMTRHGHLSLSKDVRQRLKQISAATIDRLLRDVREQAFSGQRRRAGGIGNAIRRAVPIRTFSDWNDPLPGYLEVDFVEHCGGTKVDGDFVHSFVMTDIATGWTECLTMPYRSGAFVLEHIERVSRALPFPLRGLDCDNDTAFMNAAMLDFCKAAGIELTRSRAYKKNDQAWVEQKNGAIVRRLVGYGRLRGLEATATLASLYEVSRLYINFFQPSFKLKSKTRHGAKVTKRYETPLTPLERVLRSASVSDADCVPSSERSTHWISYVECATPSSVSPNAVLPERRRRRQSHPVKFHSRISWRALERRGRPERSGRRIIEKRASHMTGVPGKIRSSIPGRRYSSGSKRSPALPRKSSMSVSLRWLPPCIPARSCAPCSAA
ncbi:integrase catalytic domain-containing protein [Paraburkholderia atlantica]|uniref:integrase catalytic domain-containing protein n=1 Tax=Paraburkholderia atlantica TaxID=2654982 RepID=UPI001D103CD0|nr:DDE-type integrase/transposase/recombinase [Paraburkholderia atlantica]